MFEQCFLHVECVTKKYHKNNKQNWRKYSCVRFRDFTIKKTRIDLQEENFYVQASTVFYTLVSMSF